MTDLKQLKVVLIVSLKKNFKQFIVTYLLTNLLFRVEMNRKTKKKINNATRVAL